MGKRGKAGNGKGAGEGVSGSWAESSDAGRLWWERKERIEHLTHQTARVGG